jgi:carbon storage regulator
MMLVLSRKPGQKIVIAGGITLTVVGVEGKRVTLGIEAPSSVHILRGELQDEADRPTVVWSCPPGESPPGSAHGDPIR